MLVHLIISNKIEPQQVKYQLQAQISQPPTKVKTEKVIALTAKLAELQSQVLRLNALGNRLADDANLPDKEFNFSQPPATGGPSSLATPISDKTLDELLIDINLFENKINYEEKQLQMLESVSFGHHIQNSGYLSGRPITKGWLSSYYGIRNDPFSGKPTLHKGVDFAGKENSPVIATASGVVTWAGKRFGYGQLVEINHGDGLKTRYGHNKDILVSVGDVVNKGQDIARMGSTGRSTGPHVHYEILRNNKQINPIKFVYRKGK
jgi:murein DD-endopeptidase MepM/ murein hydrolase activator NlpD